MKKVERKRERERGEKVVVAFDRELDSFSLSSCSVAANIFTSGLLARIDVMTLSSGNSIRGGLQTRGRCFGAGSRMWRPSLICFFLQSHFESALYV